MYYATETEIERRAVTVLAEIFDVSGSTADLTYTRPWNLETLPPVVLQTTVSAGSHLTQPHAYV